MPARRFILSAVEPKRAKAAVIPVTARGTGAAMNLLKLRPLDVFGRHHDPRIEVPATFALTPAEQQRHLAICQRPLRLAEEVTRRR